jgi:hypothetical protein
MTAVARDERSVGMQADARLHGVAYVDARARGSQLTQDAAGQHCSVSREHQTRGRQERVGAGGIALVFAPERQLEGSHCRDLKGEAVADSAHEVPTGPSAAKKVDQDVGV